MSYLYQLVVVGTDQNNKEVTLYGFCTIEDAKQQFKSKYPDATIKAIHTN